MVDHGTAKSEHPGSDGLLGLEQVIGRSHYGDSMMEMERDDFANEGFRADILQTQGIQTCSDFKRSQLLVSSKL